MKRKLNIIEVSNTLKCDTQARVEQQKSSEAKRNQATADTFKPKPIKKNFLSHTQVERLKINIHVLEIVSGYSLTLTIHVPVRFFFYNLMQKK